MSLLWVKVGKYVEQQPRADDPYAEEHHQHTMHPAFEGAGIKHSPCAFSLCPDVDWDHEAAFNKAEDIGYQAKPPVERLDLSKPVYGFEKTADMKTLRRYINDPGARQGRPTVFRRNGEHHIMDGHHGIAAALHRGDSGIDVNMINLDKEH